MRRALFLAVVVVCLATSPAMAQDPVKVDPKHHKIEFENAQVRVLRVNIGPHEKTATHEHPNRVVVFLTDDNNLLTPVGGQPQGGKQKRGDVTWVAGETHVVENMGDKPFEAVVVELKGKPAAAKPPAAKKQKKQM